jgi:plasmid stabilization system protein ParE
VKFRVRYTKAARADLRRLYSFLLDIDLGLARRMRNAIVHGMSVLEDYPQACRKVTRNIPFLHELVIPFGSAGYVVLFEIEDNHTVTILAIRHQRENDYH